jgi:prepilin signal peptidase PulO-like enzyme (type II secretory pathway)
VVLVLVLGAVAERATSKSPWGTGDLKLLILLGAILGWPLMLWALFLGVVAGGFGAATAFARRKRTLAYGPYLVAGGLVALLLPDSSP